MNRNYTKNYGWLSWFMLNNQEELCEVLSAMIKDKINEMLPQMLEDYFSQFTVDFITKINGRQVNDLKSSIIDIIIKNIK